MANIKQFLGTGRRKTSIARVYLRPNSSGLENSKIIINKKHTIQEVLHRQELVEEALRPLTVTNQTGNWNIIINVIGGGNSGQSGAISLGIARALLQHDESLRVVLRKAGLLTRDSRMVERKKYGQPGARKKFQFSKR